MVGRLNSGEAAVVGGDRLLGCFPPARGLCPELGASSDEKGVHRKTVLRRYVNSGDRMLAGGGCMVARLNSGVAAAVGGDNLFGCFPPAGGLCPELGVSSDEEGSHRKTELRRVAQLRGANAGRRKLRGGEAELRRSRRGRR